MLKSLQAKDSPLSQTEKQLEILSGGILKMVLYNFYKIRETSQFLLQAKKLKSLQINVGYMCNQVCAHCHGCWSDRKEIMTAATMQQILDVLKLQKLLLLDLTMAHQK
jgi:hypothetical protein